MAAVSVTPGPNGSLAVVVCGTCERGLEVGLSGIGQAVRGLLDHAEQCVVPTSELARRLAVVRSSGSAA